MTQEVQVIPAHQQVTLERNLYLPAYSFEVAIQRRTEIVKFVTEMMIKDQDFGVIPGTDKPALLKPGAEKLCNFFGLEICPEITESIKDFTGQDHGGESFFYVSYRITLKRNGKVVGAADGSCNSWESKYRYRWVSESEVPEGLDLKKIKKRGGLRNIFEPNWALQKRETGGKHGKPLEYWQAFDDAVLAGTARHAKRTLGKREHDGLEIAVNETYYRVPNPDICDSLNTVEKISYKRALAAATLVCTCASEFYGQDQDDLIPEPESVPEPEPELKQQPKQTQNKPVEGSKPSLDVENDAAVIALYAALAKPPLRDSIRNEFTHLKEAFIELGGTTEDYLRICAGGGFSGNLDQTGVKMGAYKAAAKALLLEVRSLMAEQGDAIEPEVVEA